MRVLASEQFARSDRLRRFLTFIIERSLDNRLDELKEYNIALAVYDRDPSFDPRTDNIVRVEARRLRQQLSSYYNNSGRADDLLIEIPKGGYSPVFLQTHRPRRRFRGYVVAAAIPLVLGATVALWPKHGVPTSWRLEQTTLIVSDAKGRLCWRAELPLQDGESERVIRDRVLIQDIDQDGRVEVLVNVAPENLAAHGGYLQCHEQDGRIRWTRRYGARKTFGSRTFEPGFIGRYIRSVSLDGKPAILTLANHFIWYPAQAALLDPKTGQVQEEYWHPGAFYECVLADLDRDGKDELLLGAINNPGDGLGAAALAVLKIPFSAAPPRPAHPDAALAPLTGGGEAAYVLFPMPDVSRAMGLLPVVRRLSVDAARNILVVTPLPEDGGLVYTLGSDLSLRSFRVSDNYRDLHDRYHRQGLLDHPLSDRELAALGRVLAFPAAPDGNSPALRRLWDATAGPAQ